MGRITPLQIYMLFSQFLFSTTIGFYISPLVEDAQFSVWASLILASLMGLAITYCAFRLSLRRPNHSLGHYGHEILGSWIHYPVMLIFIFFKLFAAAFLMRQLLYFIVQNFLQGTPEWAVAAMFGIVVAYGVRSGPLVLFRSAQGLFFLSIFSAIIFPLFAAKEINVDMSIAFLTNVNVIDVWNKGIIMTGSFAEMSILIFIFPYCEQQNKIFKALIWAVVTSLVITLANLITCIMLFGPDLTANMAYPTLELIRYIRAGAFIENLDAVLILFWVYTIYLKIGVFLLVAVLAFTHTFGFKDYKPFSFLMTVMMVYLSLYMFKSAFMLEHITKYSEPIFFLVTSSIFLIYWLVDTIRSYGRSKKDKKEPSSLNSP